MNLPESGTNLAGDVGVAFVLARNGQNIQIVKTNATIVARDQQLSKEETTQDHKIEKCTQISSSNNNF